MFVILNSEHLTVFAVFIFGLTNLSLSRPFVSVFNSLTPVPASHPLFKHKIRVLTWCNFGVETFTLNKK